MARLSLLLLLWNSTRQPLATPVPTEAPYDHNGAFWFVAIVMTVYAMAILFMIMSHINRRDGKRELDREVNIFLRSTPTVRIEEERQRRRNLKRAMQPFIRMAMDKRTIGVHVSIADDSTGDLLTLTSIETLADNTLELLPASGRVVKSNGGGRRGRGGYRCRLSDLPQSRRLSASSRGSSADAASMESGWQSGSFENLVAAPGGCGHNKAVQCGLDPRQTLASRARWLLTSVPSEAELGASATSQKMEVLMLARQSQQQQREQQQQQRMKSAGNHKSAEDEESLRISASQTHVPRFLAVGTVPKGGAAAAAAIK